MTEQRPQVPAAVLMTLAELILDRPPHNTLFGCRIRLEWVDEKPPFADDWARKQLGIDNEAAS